MWATNNQSGSAAEEHKIMSKNTEVIEVRKAYFRDHPGALDEIEAWMADNQGASEIDERLAKLAKSGGNKAKDVAKLIADTLKGEGTALTPEQIVAKINANLRKNGSNETATIGQINGWLRLKGIRSEKKPEGRFQKDAAGRVSYIEQPDADDDNGGAVAQEDKKTKPAGKRGGGA